MLHIDDADAQSAHRGLHSQLHRRRFLEIGGLSCLGLSLPQVLAARSRSAANGAAPRQTSVIFLELAGGPSQFETYDPKPDAPRECRGMFGFVDTNLPGVLFSDLMSRQARIVDKLAIVRSVRHRHNSHDPSSHLTQTGYYKTGLKGGPNQFPCIGSVAAKLRGAGAVGMPAYVAVPKVMRNGRSAFLGNAFNPFDVGKDPNDADFRVDNLALDASVPVSRLEGRRQLREEFDRMRRLRDVNAARALDRFTQEAFELVTSNRAREAFELDREDQRLRDHYGRTTVGQGMLLARRLVEAGVTFVSVRVIGWDNHQRIEPALKNLCPPYDQGVTALVEDIYARGLDCDVLVVAMGEFGRTPKINQNAGRDHWGPLMSVLFSGGGLRVGQIVGASNSLGEEPTEAVYHPGNVLAMIYRHLGIDPATTLNDFSGRPRHLLEQRDFIRELI